jgi:hypothetical protein
MNTPPSQQRGINEVLTKFAQISAAVINTLGYCHTLNAQLDSDIKLVTKQEIANAVEGVSNSKPRNPLKQVSFSLYSLSIVLR